MAAALIVIDMQMIMQQRLEGGRPHVHGEAPEHIAALLAAFRNAGRAVIHVRHADSDPMSPLHPTMSGYPVMACARETEGEAIFIKNSSSAFATTDLEAHLRSSGVKHLYIIGAVAGFCVNSTVRSASDFGFGVSVIRDAVIGFDLPSAGLDAQTIFDVTMGLLAADFAEVTDSAAVLASL